jgi:hypothetical protein
MVAAAIAGSAVIGGVTSMIGGSQAASAAEHGADVQAEANKYAADIQKQIFEQQRADLAPWRTAGNAALNEITALNGLAPAIAPTTVTIPGATTTTRVPVGSSAIVNSSNPIFGAIASRVGNIELPGGYRIVTTTGQPTVTTTPGKTSAQQQQEAFDRFHASPGYQFSFSEGQRAIENSAAARGGVHSGATMKALDRFGTGLANQEYGDYYNRLAAEAGIGQTAVQSGNQAAQNYGNSAAQLAANTGAARASAYGAAGQAMSNAYGGVASAINGGIGNYLYLNALQNYGAGTAGTFQPVQITPQVNPAAYGF